VVHAVAKHRNAAVQVRRHALRAGARADRSKQALRDPRQSRLHTQRQSKVLSRPAIRRMPRRVVLQVSYPRIAANTELGGQLADRLSNRSARRRVDRRGRAVISKRRRGASLEQPGIARPRRRRRYVANTVADTEPGAAVSIAAV